MTLALDEQASFAGLIVAVMALWDRRLDTYAISQQAGMHEAIVAHALRLGRENRRTRT